MDCLKLKEILFYSRKIITVPSGSESNGLLAMTAIRNLTDFGFVIDGNGVSMLCTAAKEDIERWYRDTVAKFMELAGADHQYKPFYPNFPEQVIGMTDLQLFIDQITHYITVAAGEIMGIDETAWRPAGKNLKEGIKSLESHPLKVIETISDNDESVVGTVAEVFQNVLRSKTTPSPDDMRHIINPYISAKDGWVKDASVISNRKVLSYLYVMALLGGMDTSMMPALTANDYLRTAMLYSYMKVKERDTVEDFSWMKKWNRIVSLPNSFRRFIASGLDKLPNLEEDVARNKNAWKELFRIIHVGRMPYFENLYRVAWKLRAGKKLNTFNARVKRAFRDKHYMNALQMYSSRPGEFVKNINKLITVEIEDKDVLSAYTDCLLTKTDRIFASADPVDLVRLVMYLRSRTRENRIPVHNVSGRLVQGKGQMKPIPEETARLFIDMAMKGIAEQIKTEIPYGKVYIDPSLEKFPVPTESTNRSETMNSWARGTRVPLERNEDGSVKNVRAFVWWTNMEREGNERSRVDLDLSICLFNESGEQPGFDYLSGVSYHESFNYRGAIIHSGDITDGGSADGPGATEYIDVDMGKSRKLGIDYIACYVNSFTGQKFRDIPCLAGWQEREELDRTDQFDPRAVKQTNKLTNASCGTVMFVIDVKNGEMVWLDAPDMTASANTNSLVMTELFGMVFERYMRGDHVSMKELAELAVSVNGGEIVETPEDADTAFVAFSPEWDTGDRRIITAKDRDVWIGEFMSPHVPNESVQE